MSDRTPIVVSPQDYKNQQIAESKRQASEQRLDEGPEGGRYEVGDQMVDANGDPRKGGDTAADSGPAERPALRTERK